MNNQERRDLLEQTKQAQAQGFTGSVLDVFSNPMVLQEFAQQQATPPQSPQVQQAPQQAPSAPVPAPAPRPGIKLPAQSEARPSHLVESFKPTPVGTQTAGTPHKMRNGGPTGDPTKKWPALKSLGEHVAVPDSTFTQGYGDIEYFSPKQDTIRYKMGDPSTYVAHPAPGKHATLYNPTKFKSQEAADQAIRLDLLHGMPAADSEYRRHYTDFSKAFEAEHEGDIKGGYEQARKEGRAGDGYEAYKRNYIDGTIRNMLFEGTEQDFQDARYWPQAKEVYSKNPGVKHNFSKIKNYLETGYPGLLPEVEVKRNGGPTTEPPLFGIDSELLKAGIRGTESSNGVNMMNMSANSTATGYYGQRFSELADLGLYSGTREEFSKDLDAQDKIFNQRLNEGLGGERSMMDSLEHMYTNYADQIEQKGYTAEQVGGIINMLGREGTRRYLGYVVRDGKTLEEVFPKLYGGDKIVTNKTPDEYAGVMQEWMDKYSAEYCEGDNCEEPKKRLGGRSKYGLRLGRIRR